jgi:tripartite-type tricarboxylate transporter receptor subunit TctC
MPMRLLLLLLATVALSAGPARAQTVDFPSKPVRIVVAFLSG